MKLKSRAYYTRSFTALTLALSMVPVFSSNSFSNDIILGPPNGSEELNISNYIDIPELNIYNIDLWFGFRSERERILAKELAGDSYTVCKNTNRCGSLISFQIEIFDDTGLRVVEVNAAPFGYYYFDSNKFSRNVMSIMLHSGRHKVIIKSKNDVFKNRDVNFNVSISDDPRQAPIKR